MATVISEGSLRSLERASAHVPTQIRLSDDFTQDYAEIWRKQPAVRTVVQFLARNISQLSIRTFRRLSDQDRERLRDHGLAQLLGSPNSFTTQYRLIRSLINDLGIYDTAYWLKLREAGKPALFRLPPSRVKVGGENWIRPEFFELTGSRGKAQIAPNQIVYFRGYNPTDDRLGVSPIETLRQTLAEEWAAGNMREQTMRNGARMSGYIKRPPSNQQWSDDAFKRFKEDWRAQYVGNGPQAGGTPILEDGMEFISASQTAEQLQYIEGRKLTREEVASAYFIPPPMVGLLDKATFSNITEQHKMLYQDTLGPWLKEISQDIQLQLLPDFPDTDQVYVEFNMEEKLRGSFEEQAQQLQSSVGGPYMTRNEARGRLNLPSIEGGDQLIVPLNVIIGGQASPQDSVPKEMAPDQIRVLKELVAQGVKSAGVRLKAQASDGDNDLFASTLAKFFKRQAAVVRAALGAKADGWWDEDRWNDELAADLYALALKLSERVGKDTLSKLDLDPSEYDVNQTLHYLEAVAANTAGRINSVTKQQLDDAIADAEDLSEAVGHVFEVAQDARAPQAGTSIVTGLVGFAAVESLKQAGREEEATKTWIVTSKNPRPSHAQMDGETVALSENFSNGAAWPGDLQLGVDEIAGCMCALEMFIP